MFASRWSNRYPMFEGYIMLSEIVRAWSSMMTGPYSFTEKILPSGNSADWDGRMAHNPTVVKYGSKYLLYYIASTYEQTVPEPELVKEGSSFLNGIYQRIGIGMLIANHPTGPWKNIGKPILESRPGKWDSKLVTNPAPCITPDGTIYLYYRSNTPEGLRIGLAVAQTPEGPYERIQDDPVMQGITIEDPFVWHNGRCFEMIAKDMTGDLTGERHSGAHFESADGINWQVSDPPQAYSKTIHYTDGQTVTLGSLERPQLLLDDNNIPQCMCAAVADGPGGFRNADNTWNVVIPLTVNGGNTTT